MEGGLDRADGGLLFNAGLRERAEDDRFAVFDSGLFDHAIFDAGRDERHGDIRVWLAGFGLVEAGDGEIERIFRVRFAVDLDGVGSDHNVWIFWLAVGESFF